MAKNFAFFDDQATGRQLYFAAPKEIISVRGPRDVDAAFHKIEQALARGKYIVGYFAYELGHALEPKLQPPLSMDTPLIHIGIFDAPSAAPPAELLYTAAPPQITLTPDWSEADYLARFEKLQAYIAAGDCYQVNLTFPMTGQTEASAAQIYAGFRRKQPGRYGALLSLGGPEIMSFSPELFFEKTGHDMRMRPMKGTRPRSEDDDTAVAEAMRAEPKSQAENLMIVDLLRNDLSRLAEAGSVKVPELFTLETYPTVHQMTSQVTAKLSKNISWQEIFGGLFPCGSVTGAPKIRAMDVITELEDSARGPYCGAVGFIAPNGDACFNVAIRTAVLDNGALRYNVGSGVVYDSDGPDEYRECLLKSRIFTPQSESLIETLLWTPEAGYQYEAAHKTRLLEGARKNDIPLSAGQLDEDVKPQDWTAPQRVRWELDKVGKIKITSASYTPITEPLKIAVSQYPLTKAVQRHDVKTSRRDFYDGERARIKALLPEVDEVIFVNAAGQLCEGSFTSLFLDIDGARLTPALSAGLLPGVLRGELITSGDVSEATLTPADLSKADAVWLGNSLRGLMRAELVQNKPI